MPDLSKGETITVSIEISNNGEYDGKETVQLYIRDKVASIMRPLRELKGYKKMLIKKGETLKVDFNLTYKYFGFYNGNGEFTVEKGKFEIFVGDNCLTQNKIILEIC